MLRLKRQRAELDLKKSDLRSQYIVEARQDLAKVSEEVEALAPVVRGRSDTLQRLTLRSPVRGVVKNIEVSTIGGVIPPNGKIMEIVPLDERLLVEARMSPRDIAFIRPASVPVSRSRRTTMRSMAGWRGRSAASRPIPSATRSIRTSITTGSSSAPGRTRWSTRRASAFRSCRE